MSYTNCNSCHKSICPEKNCTDRCLCVNPDYAPLGCASFPELKCILLKKDYPCLNLRKGQSLENLLDSLEISKCLQGCDCNIPANLVVTFEAQGVSSTDMYTANVSWSAATGATGYTLQYKACSSSEWTTISVNQSGTTSSSLTIDPTCFPEKCFDFRVKAVCASCQSDYNVLSNQILVECTPPFNLCWDYEDQILSWESSPNLLPAAFTIGFKKYSELSYTFIVLSPSETVVGSGLYSVDLSSISFVSDYRYDFYVGNSCGSTSTVSGNLDTCTSTNCVVPVQSDPVISGITDTTAIVTFAPILGVTGYNIKVHNTTTDILFKPTTNIGVATVYNLSGLSMGNSYEVTIGYSCNGTVSCFTKTVSFTSTGSDCSNPQNLAVSSNFVMTWTPSTTAFTTAQRAYYRKKTTGGSFLTSGFTPANDLTTLDTTASVAGLTNNEVYEFRVANLCITGGPNYNSNGIKEAIKFNCSSAPVISLITSTGSTATVSGLPSDITKVRFTLYDGSGTTIIQGPVDIATSAGSAVKVYTGLTTATNYIVAIQLIAVVNGTEQMSSFGTSCNETFLTI